MKDYIALSLSVVFCVGSLAYQVYVKNELEITAEKQSTEIQIVKNYVDSIGFELDSIKRQNIGLGKSVIYLDSCQSIRTTKTERAERRGKFVGGLLKSLFPSL